MTGREGDYNDLVQRKMHETLTAPEIERSRQWAREEVEAEISRGKNVDRWAQCYEGAFADIVGGGCGHFYEIDKLPPADWKSMKAIGQEEGLDERYYRSWIPGESDEEFGKETLTCADCQPKLRQDLLQSATKTEQAEAGKKQKFVGIRKTDEALIRTGASYDDEGRLVVTNDQVEDAKKEMDDDVLKGK